MCIRDRRGMGFDTQDGRYTTPAPDEHMLGELFGDLAGEVRATCMLSLIHI